MNRRELYEEHTKKVGKTVARLGLTPNQLTVLSLIPAAVSGYFYYENRYIVGGLFVLLTLFFDVFDGSVARALNKQTNFGAVLDPAVDRYCEVLILSGILLGGLAESWTVLFCFSGMILASYVRAKAEAVGVPEMTAGMQRLDKMIIVMAGSVACLWFESGLTFALIAVGVLSHLTAVKRLADTRRKLQ